MCRNFPPAFTDLRITISFMHPPAWTHPPKTSHFVASFRSSLSRPANRLTCSQLFVKTCEQVNLFGKNSHLRVDNLSIYDIARKSSVFLRNFEFFNKHCVDNEVMTGKEFADRVDFCLNKRNQTRKAITADLGISSSTMSSWAAGRGSIPNANVAAQIAEYLGVSLDWLITGKEYECHETARNLPPPEILELAEDIYRLPVEFQKIIIGNVEDYKALCFKLEKENTQGIG